VYSGEKDSYKEMHRQRTIGWQGGRDQDKEKRKATLIKLSNVPPSARGKGGRCGSRESGRQGKAKAVWGRQKGEDIAIRGQSFKRKKGKGKKRDRTKREIIQYQGGGRGGTCKKRGTKGANYKN